MEIKGTSKTDHQFMLLMLVVDNDDIDTLCKHKHSTNVRHGREGTSR